MRIRYTPRAFADREAIYEYYDRRNPRMAREVKTFIKKRINDLRYFPERYALIQERDARALFVGRYQKAEARAVVTPSSGSPGRPR